MSSKCGPALGVDERVRLMRDGVVNNAGLLVSAVVGILLVPIMLKGLGPESYGLWVAALALAAMPRGFDFGLGWSLVREVGATGGEARDETARFVISAGNAYVVFGVVGAVVIFSVGMPLSSSLHLSAQMVRVANAVFMLGGLLFFADGISSYAMAILAGLRRFDVVNLISTAGSLLRAAGIIALLAAGGGLLAVLAWVVVTTAVTAYAGLAVVAHAQPRFRFRLGLFDWSSVKAHIEFSIASQLSVVAIACMWDSAPLLIGLLLGPAFIAQYNIGQKIPGAVSGFSWRLAEVLVPAASEYERTRDTVRARAALVAGTRWNVLLTLPLCVGLWILAPNVLQAWVGQSHPDTLLVLRVLAAAVLIDAMGVSALHVLWGSGAARTVLALLAGITVSCLAFSFALVTRIGISGAAWGLLLPVTFGSAVFLCLASQRCGIRVPDVIRAALAGLLFPTLLSAAVACSLRYLTHPNDWMGVIATAGAAGLSYATFLYARGAEREERILAREIVTVPLKIVRSGYRNVRRALRGVGFLRSGWYLAIEVKRFLLDGPNVVSAKFDCQYERHVDLWSYGSKWGEGYLAVTAEILDGIHAGQLFQRALEIGCGEGFITELLAPRCHSVLAVDASPTALARARERCRNWDHVRFAEWCLHSDPISGTFDLVLMMAVLEYFYRPSDLRAARAKIVEALAPGGHLLVASTRQSELVESARWARWLVRGSQNINAFVGEHRHLVECTTAAADTHLFTLFRKAQ